MENTALPRINGGGIRIKGGSLECKPLLLNEILITLYLPVCVLPLFTPVAVSLSRWKSGKRRPATPGLIFSIRNSEILGPARAPKRKTKSGWVRHARDMGGRWFNEQSAVAFLYAKLWIYQDHSSQSVYRTFPKTEATLWRVSISGAKTEL